MSGNVDYIGYEVTTPGGFNCRFTPTKKGLYVCKIKYRSSKNVFGKDTLENVTILGGSCHYLVEDEDGPNTTIPRVSNVEDENGNEVNVQSDPTEAAGVEANDKRKVMFTEAIETIRGSRDRFSKRDQLRADRVRRLQHVSGFLSDQTIAYSLITNGIRNNPISKRDADVCDGMLGKNSCAPKGKRIMV